MTTSEEDDELQRAIALSLQEASAAASSDGESSYERDMRLAMALSLEGAPKTAAIDNVTDSETISAGVGSSRASLPQYDTTVASKSDNKAQRQAGDPAAHASHSSTLPTAFLLNRKAMEEERLARLGKRKRSVSPARPSKQIAKQANPAPSNAIRYPKGAVKRTWAYKHPRTDDISLEEVLQASTLNIAVLSSFQWDDRFIFHKADPKKIKHYWIMGAKEETERAKILAELTECNIPNLKPHFPPMRGVYTMHSKLMLLFHDTHLRIVIPTANLTKVEWGETGQDPKTVGTWQSAVFENTLFLIDLPRRPGGEKAEELDTAFGQELISFLEAQEVGRNVIDGLHKFDFSETSRFALVHSIGGTHSAEPRRSRTGLPGLARAIRQLNLHDVERLELEYASSSLGGLKEEFLQQIYVAASGLHPLTHKAPEGCLDNFRVYFPTHDTVFNSTGGVDCGGIITLNSKSYGAPSFARECLKNHKSTRPGLLSHNKLLLARGYKKDGTPFAWAYIGSANATESAWGSQSILKSGKESALKIRNWECGIVVPVPTEELQGLTKGEIPPMSVFWGTVEVPFEFPGEDYEGKKPWFFMDLERGDSGQ